MRHGQVLGRPRFVAYLVVMAFSMGVTFAYVATSAFVLQSMNGLSPMMYSIVFAANAVGLALATLAAGRLAGRVATRTVITDRTGRHRRRRTPAAGRGHLVGMPLWVAIVGFFVLMSAQGLVGANAGALASNEVPEHPGTGSAVLGFLQWCMAGVIAPLAGLGGDRTAVPMAVIILVLTVASLAAMALTRTSPRPLPIIDLRASPRKGTPSCEQSCCTAPSDVRVDDVPMPRIVEDGDAIISSPPPASAAPTCGPTAASTRSPPRPPIGHEYCGVVAGGRLRGHERQARRLRRRLVLRLRQHLRDLPRPATRAGACTGTAWARQNCQAEYLRVPLADGTLVATPPCPTRT